MVFIEKQEGKQPMQSFKDLYTSDLARYGRKPSRYLRVYHYLLRKAQTSTGIKKQVFHDLLLAHSLPHGIELSDETITGKGLYIGHAYCITVNKKAVLGENVNIHGGVLIGRENRGKRKGAPTIGNYVWIGMNAAIVGKVTVGDDVLIAPNAYVNFDVPDHSIVIGNPGKIYHCDNATKDYINYAFEQ